jgi:thiosulfate/3-mercaptopyruvate sulfurtransferase
MYSKPLVSVDWLHDHLEDQNLIILDATIFKVGAKEKTFSTAKEQIIGATFFDIKNTFSDTSSKFPNTILSIKKFEIEVRNLGINNNSKLVVYDDLGIYSSPRVWWMFQLMGFQNIAVLDGGLPAWKAKNYPTENSQTHALKKGDFTAIYHSEKIKFIEDVIASIDNSSLLIADARSKERFLGTVSEPRKEVRSGHIPNAVCVPYTEMLQEGKMKSAKELACAFLEINPAKKELIFTCGTGITACILALGATLSGIDNYSVYDGSWTEWGSSLEGPISGQH